MSCRRAGHQRLDQIVTRSGELARVQPHLVGPLAITAGSFHSIPESSTAMCTSGFPVPTSRAVCTGSPETQDGLGCVVAVSTRLMPRIRTADGLLVDGRELAPVFGVAVSSQSSAPSSWWASVRRPACSSRTRPVDAGRIRELGQRRGGDDAEQPRRRRAAPAGAAPSEPRRAPSIAAQKAPAPLRNPCPRSHRSSNFQCIERCA